MTRAKVLKERLKSQAQRPDAVVAWRNLRRALPDLTRPLRARPEGRG